MTKTIKLRLRVALIVVLGSAWTSSQAQWMKIDEGGGEPDSSAALEIADTTRGLLIPRLTNSQMNSVSSPASGLMIYNTDSAGFYYYNGSLWTTVGSLGQTEWSVPIGTIIPFAGDTSNVPVGFLLCDGSSLDTATYSELFAAIDTAWGASGGNFNIPDLRGRFLRGVDLGAGNDPDASSRIALNTGGNTGDNVGSAQDHELESHTHDFSRTTGAGGSLTATIYDNIYSNVSTQQVTSSGGNETRPINANVNYIICYNSALAAAAASNDLSQYNQNLQSVLAVGADAGGLDIRNVDSLSIGTTAPTAELTVRGVSDFTNDGNGRTIRIDGNGEIESVSGQTMYLNRSVINTVRISDGGGVTEIGRNGGKVGIGTAAPALYKVEIDSLVNIDTLILGGNIRLPSNIGSNGQVLTTDGAGIASWQSPASFSTPGLDSVLAVNADGNNDTIFNLGALGIGTNSPNNLLQVHTSSNNQAGIRISTATSGLTTNDGLFLRYNDASGARLTVKENNSLGFGTNNLMRMYIDSTGEIGIGTTTPDSALEVVGGIVTDNFRMTNGSSLGRVLVSDANGSGTWTDVSSVVDDSQIRDGDTDTYITTDGTGSDDDNIFFGTAGSDRAVLDSLGRFGLGTSDPQGLLSLTGDSSNTITIRAINNNDSTGIAWRNTGSSYVYGIRRVGNDGLGFAAGGSTNPSSLPIRMFIDRNTGFIGMDTLEPQEQLHIQGGNLRVNNEVQAGAISIGHTAPQAGLHILGDSLGAIKLQVSNNANDQGLMFQNSGGLYSWTMFRSDEGSNDAVLNFRGGPNDADPNNLPYRLRMKSTGQIIFNDSIGYGEFSISSRNSDTTVFAIKSTTDTNLFRLRQNSNGSAQMYMHKSDGTIGVDLRAGTGDSYIRQGQFGLGTQHPLTKLHLHGGIFSVYNGNTNSNYIIARDQTDSTNVFNVAVGSNGHAILNLYQNDGTQAVKITSGTDLAFFNSVANQYSFGSNSIISGTTFQVVNAGNMTMDLDGAGTADNDVRLRFRDDGSNKFQYGYDDGLGKLIISASNWTGDRLVYVDSIGHVGIGEDSDVAGAHLNVAGDIEVDGDYTYEADQNRVYSLPPAAFQLLQEIGSTTISNIERAGLGNGHEIYIAGGAITSSAVFHAPLSLPQNAVIDSIVYFYVDNNNIYEVIGRLQRQNLSNGTTASTGSTSSGTTAASAAFSTMTGTGGYTIDNTAFNYWVRWRTQENTNTLTLRGANVYYRVSKAD